MKAAKVIAAVVALSGGLVAFWWTVFSLKSYDITAEEFQARYAYPRSAVAVELTPIGSNAAALEFRSFDGDRVIGRIVYPGEPGPETKRFPVLIGLHGLGRTHLRWWQAELKGRPTIEGTHLITKLALERGYAVIALDARRHGQRDPKFAASSLLTGMKLWGQREPYERMVIDTVKDYRMLLDWIQQQPALDASRIHVAGYSMGAQMALLLASTDPRVSAVAAMVPPSLDDKVAAVSPRRAVPGLAGRTVWLLSADEDQYSTPTENANLFAAIAARDKRHLRFSSGHALPSEYVEKLLDWF